MTKLSTRIVLLAAGTLMCATAWGQDRLRANIPFAFRTAGASMPAGVYNVNVGSPNGVSTVIILRNVETRKSVITVGRSESPNVATSKPPVISFVCGTATCSLQRIWTGQTSLVYDGAPKPSAGEHIASVPLATAHGE